MSRSDGGRRRSAARSLAAAGASLAVLAPCAAVHAWFLALPASRSVLLTLLLVGPAAGSVAALCALRSRSSPFASGAGPAVALFAAAVAVVPLHARYNLVGGSAKGVAAALAVPAGALGLFLALRWLGARAPAAVVWILAGAGLAVTAAALPRAWMLEPEDPPLAPAWAADLPNLLLFTADTLRADAVAPYGAAYPTPAFERLAREGATFDRVYASSPWTLPSMATMLTGEAPSTLGVDRHTGIPAAVPTLAERLVERGYETQAVVTNAFLGSPYGFQRGFHGFDHMLEVGFFDDLARHPLYQLGQEVKFHLFGDDAGRIVERAVAWLGSRRETDRPFFLWVHVIDPHQPYGGETIRGDLPCGAREAPEIGYRFDEARAVRHGDLTLNPAQRRHLVHLYEAEVRFVDRQLARLLEGLDRLDLSATTLVAVTSDHGEEFWEHGGFEHGHSLHVEVTRVPLLVRWPDRVAAGQRTAAVTTFEDLHATLLGAALPSERPESPGLPLPALAARRGDVLAISENLLYGPQRRAARDERLSWIERVDAPPLVYDHRHDLAETRPLHPSEPAAARLASRLAIELERRVDLRLALGIESAPRRDFTRFERERLRALGYVQ